MDGSVALQRHRKSLPERACEKCSQMYTPGNANVQRWCKVCCPSRTALNRLKSFNISQPEYEAMLIKQNGLCDLCKEKPAVVVDHKHHGCQKSGSKRTCGKCVRGLLCKMCNLFLAAWEAHPELIHKGQDYLKRHYYAAK